jgi:hypothetical protein
MKIIINENRLHNIFYKYMEDNFGELSIDEYDEITYKDSNGDDSPFGYIQYVSSEGKFIFYFYFNGRMEKSIASMFGNQWDNLLLKYLQERFPAYHIEDVQF